MASTTLLALIQECANKSGWYTSGAPSENASATTSFKMNGAGVGWDESSLDTDFRFGWAKVESDSAGTPLNVGEVRRIKTFTPGSASFALHASRGFSNAATTTMTIGVYMTIPPTQWGTKQGWTQYINRTLRNVMYRRYGLLSLVTDGDQETSGVANWTQSNCTATKVTAAANVAFGAQALQVANSQANGYARSALVNVAAGDFYVLRADVKASSGTGVAEVYDETNSASITTESSAYRDWRYLDYTFTVPSGCHQVSVRLKGTESTATVFWDNVSLRPQSGRRLPVPSWLDDLTQFEWVYETWGLSTQGDSRMGASQRFRQVPDCDLVSDPAGANPWLVDYRFIPRDASLLWVRGLSSYDELSSDSGTTAADKDLVVAGARALAYRDVYGVADPRYLAALKEFKAKTALLPHRERPIRGAY